MQTFLNTELIKEKTADTQDRATKSTGHDEAVRATRDNTTDR